MHARAGNARVSIRLPSTRSSSVRQPTASEAGPTGGIGRQATLETVEGHYGPDAYPKSLKKGLYRQTKDFGPDRVGQWAAEGMPTDMMGKPRDMEEFRERQEARSPEVPKHIEQQNEASVHRSKKAQQDMDPSGDVGIPGSVRGVLSSPGKNLDGDVRGGLEDRLGTSLDHVQVHTGPKAQQACEEVNARAFAVGNHIAFGPGEYDPSSAEGQHLIAHEVVHTLQQPEAEMSMMPKADLDVEIDPDPKAEREADQIAGEVMKGGDVGMTKSWQADVHVQRATKNDGMLYGAVEELQEQVVDHDEKLDEHETNIEGIEQRQEKVMGTMLEASPGASEAFDWEGAAVKGAAGAGTGLMLGLATGSPEVASASALVGAGTAVAKDVSKELMGTLMNNRPGGETDKLDEMYAEMAQMYEEFMEAKERHGGTDIDGVR